MAHHSDFPQTPIEKALANFPDSFWWRIAVNTTQSIGYVKALGVPLVAGEGLFTQNVASGDDPATAFYATMAIRLRNTSLVDLVSVGGDKRQQWTLFPTAEIEIPLSNVDEIFVNNPVTSVAAVDLEIMLFKKDK